MRSDPRLRMRSPHYYSERQVLAYLRRIVAPTCLVHSERGLLAGRDMGRRYAVVERLSTRQVSGGHHVHLDAPLQVAPFIEEALA